MWHEKCLASSTWLQPIRQLYTLIRSPLSLLFSKMNNPSLSLHGMCSRPFNICVALAGLSAAVLFFLNWGTHNWTQCSRGAHQDRAEGSITSLDLLVTLFLTHPTIPLTILATLLAHSKPVNISTPRSFSEDILFSRSAPSLYWYTWLFLPRRRKGSRGCRFC